MIEELMAAWEAGTLTDDQRRTLNDLVREDPGPVAAQLHVEAMLRWHHGLPASSSRRVIRWASWAAAAALLVGLLFFFRAPALSPDWRVAGAAEWRVLDSNRIRLTHGELHVAGAGNLVIETPNGEATASGTEFLIAAHQGGDAMFTRVFVLAGIVTMTNAMGSASAGPSELLLAKQDEAPVKEVVRSNSQFGIDLYQRLVADQPDENLFISPYSIASVLAMVSEGARGDTALQLGNVLHFPEAARREGDDAQRIPWETARVHSGIAALNRLFNREETDEQREIKKRMDEIKETLEGVRKEMRDAHGEKDWNRRNERAREEEKLVDEFNGLAVRVAAYELSVANAIFGAKAYPFDPDFVKTVTGAYDTGAVEEVDFAGDPDGARRLINAWAAERTRDRIKDVLPPGSVDAMTRMVLVNAVYFKGDWVTPFRFGGTERKPFTLADGSTVETPIMDGSGMKTARYAAFNADGSLFATPDEIERGQTEGLYPDGGFLAIELPYRGDDVAMTVLVPVRHDGLAALEKLLSAERLEAWTAALKKRETNVFMPKFRAEWAMDLRETLEALGLTDLFGPKSDLSGLTRAAEPVSVSGVFHKTFIDVSEKGTEAAAVTALPAPGAEIREMVPFVPTVRADRPFVYMIRDVRSGTVLFVGRKVKP